MDADHLFAQVGRAREALDELETHIIDLFPGDEFTRTALLEGVSKVRQELKVLHYKAIPWST